MISMTPVCIEVVSFNEDGEHTRHYHFRLIDTAPDTVHAWQQARCGQFFMLCLPGVGEAPFTFTALPDEHGHFRALIREMGGVTQALFAAKIGDILGARGPFGQGWPMEKLDNQRVLVIGAGCGMAPLVSIVERLINKQNYTQLEVVYAARSKAALMLNPERERWQHTIPMFNVVEDMEGLEEPAYYPGTATGILPNVLHAFGEQPDIVLVAGPEAMMSAVAEYLIAYGLDPESIYLSVERRMHCAVGLCGHCYLQHRYVCTDGPTFTWADLN